MTKAASTARKICDQRCKKTFTTRSATSGNLTRPIAKFPGHEAGRSVRSPPGIPPREDDGATLSGRLDQARP
jgi:hypothetical protein